MNDNRRWRPSLQWVFVGVSLVSLLLLALQGRELVQNEIDRRLSVDLQHQAALVGQNLLERYEQMVEAEREGKVSAIRASFAMRQLAQELGLASAVGRAGGGADGAGSDAHSDAYSDPNSDASADVRDADANRPADPELISSATMSDTAIEFREVVKRTGTPSIFVGAGRSLQSWLEAVKKQTLAGLTVVDNQGIVLASSETEWLGRQATGMNEVKLALQQGRRQAARRPRVEVPPAVNPLFRTNPYQIAVVIPFEYEGYVWGAVHALRTPQSVGEFLSALPALAKWLLVLPFGLIPLGLLAAAQFFAVCPLARLQEQAAFAADGEDKAELMIRHPRSREVADLSVTVAQMAGALRQQRDSALQQAESLAHSLWNSLAPAESDAELLRESADRMSDAEREATLRRIERATRDGRRLAKKALDLARARAGRDLYGRTDVEEVVDEVASGLPNLRVECNLPQTALPRVDLEAEAFAEVCENLLHNAEQAGAAEVIITANPSEHHLELRFQDDGSGVPEDVRDTLFEPYVTSRLNEGGHGVGLAHVRAMVESVGGTIALASASDARGSDDSGGTGSAGSTDGTSSASGPGSTGSTSGPGSTGSTSGTSGGRGACLVLTLPLAR
jgi:signal transduction histidine kinase